MPDIDLMEMEVYPMGIPSAKWWWVYPTKGQVFYITERKLLSPRRARREFALHDWYLPEDMPKSEWVRIIRGSIRDLPGRPPFSEPMKNMLVGLWPGEDGCR